MGCDELFEPRSVVLSGGDMYVVCPRCNLYHPLNDAIALGLSTDLVAALPMESRDNAPASCPSCGSTSIQALKRGVTLSTGLLGAGEVEVVCLSCGSKSMPGMARIQEHRKVTSNAKYVARLAAMAPEERERYNSTEEVRKRHRYYSIGGTSIVLGFIAGCGSCIAIGRADPGGNAQIFAWLFFVGIGAILYKYFTDKSHID
jgi:DNA-directed RNA polymerase subunit RPC12/RpoP